MVVFAVLVALGVEERELDHERGNEEGGGDPVARQEVEHAPEADLPAVSALRQDDGALGVGGVARSPHRLRVQIEGQQNREAFGREGHGSTPG